MVNGVSVYRIPTLTVFTKTPDDGKASRWLGFVRRHLGQPQLGLVQIETFRLRPRPWYRVRRGGRVPVDESKDHGREE